VDGVGSLDQKRRLRPPHSARSLRSGGGGQLPESPLRSVVSREGEQGHGEEAMRAAYSRQARLFFEELREDFQRELCTLRQQAWRTLTGMAGPLPASPKAATACKASPNALVDEAAATEEAEEAEVRAELAAPLQEGLIAAAVLRQLEQSGLRAEIAELREHLSKQFAELSCRADESTAARAVIVERCEAIERQQHHSLRLLESLGAASGPELKVPEAERQSAAARLLEHFRCTEARIKELHVRTEDLGSDLELRIGGFKTRLTALEVASGAAGWGREPFCRRRLSCPEAVPLRQSACSSGIGAMTPAAEEASDEAVVEKDCVGPSCAPAPLNIEGVVLERAQQALGASLSSGRLEDLLARCAPGKG